VVYVLGTHYWTLDGLFGPYIYRGEPYKVTASVNILTEAVALGCSTWLIYINRDGHFKGTRLV
jgi:hypothetical protein